MASAKECLTEVAAKSLPAVAKRGAPSYLHSVKNTISLKRNYEFRRLYNRGKSAGSKCVVVYCMKTGSPENRLGITVSSKLGGAVQRNRIRRRLKEIYRLNEHSLHVGYDIVIVARMRCRYATWSEIESSVLSLLKKLNLISKFP